MPEDDIARLLPEPPPPRASRREAAIGAAMRQFDGVEGPARPPRPATARQWPAWTRMNRAQMGAFASIALVAVIGIPLALTTLQHEQTLRPGQPQAGAAAKRTAPPADQSLSVEPSPEGALARHRSPASRPSGELRAGRSPVLAAPPPEPIEDCGKGDCVAAVRGRGDSGTGPFASLKRASEPKTAAADQDIVTSGFRAARPAPAAPASARAADESEGLDIIVTASRSTRPAAAYRRGDWNACTVNDPGQSLDGCRRLVDPAAKGAAGQAASQVSEGLSRAWNNDLDGAVSAFDAAIALQPRLAIAYLNRGLAYQRLGETDRALADLNRAVRYAPYAARGYYARSLLFREKGDIDRARADEERAAERDARYRAVVE